MFISETHSQLMALPAALPALFAGYRASGLLIPGLFSATCRGFCAEFRLPMEEPESYPEPAQLPVDGFNSVPQILTLSLIQSSANAGSVLCGFCVAAARSV